MNENIGNLDRIIRLIIGAAVLSLYFVLPGDDRFFALLGIVPLATAFIRWCPLYTLLGLRT